MTAENTRARQAAAASDLAAAIGDAIALLAEQAAAAIEARDAEIARLQGVLERIIAMPSTGVWHMDLAVAVARAALAPPPASDGGSP